MSLMCIRLERARDPDGREVSAVDAYEFIAPLTGEGYIDLDAWEEAAPYCTLRRCRRDGSVRLGALIRTDRGEWTFSYRSGGEDNEYIYRFASLAFVPGECLTITQDDETDHFYRVASITRPLVFGA